jgi:hypothetical protein
MTTDGDPRSRQARIETLLPASRRHAAESIGIVCEICGSMKIDRPA